MTISWMLRSNSAIGAACAFVFAHAAGALAEELEDRNAQVLSLVEVIELERDANDRYLLSRRLPRLTATGGSYNWDDTVIEAISGLLPDDDDAVRAYAASSLGNMGVPARGEIPALLAALGLGLEEIAGQVIYRGSSLDAICLALFRLEYRNAPWPCEDGLVEFN